MKELDFLPAAYRERSAVHHARLCQVGVILAFGVCIALATGFQFARYKFAQQELAAITAQYDDAISRTNQLAQLRREVEQTREAAELFTFLKFPWPRTQLLAEIAKSLPSQVTLRELTIVEESAKANAHRGVIAVEVAKTQSADGTPAKMDLATLLREQDHSRSEIQISGTTTDSGALHLFVMALNGTPLFESAKLTSLEAILGGTDTQSSFLVHLTVRPGYGQSGGPHAPPAVAGPSPQPWSSDRS